MVVVSSREFRTNMMSYFTESNGDDFIVKTRDHGSFKVSIKPVKRDDAILNIPPNIVATPTKSVLMATRFSPTKEILI